MESTAWWSNQPKGWVLMFRLPKAWHAEEGETWPVDSISHLQQIIAAHREEDPAHWDAVAADITRLTRGDLF